MKWLSTCPISNSVPVAYVNNETMDSQRYHKDKRNRFKMTVCVVFFSFLFFFLFSFSFVLVNWRYKNQVTFLFNIFLLFCFVLVLSSPCLVISNSIRLSQHFFFIWFWYIRSIFQSIWRHKMFFHRFFFCENFARCLFRLLL